ncbi:MAG: leucyl aminopeptidase [Patescibacteria group bacterium]
MQFTPKAKKGHIPVRFVEGNLSKFTGTRLDIAYGSATPLVRRKYVLLMRKVVNFAKANKVKNIDINFKDLRALAPKSWSDEEVGRVAATAFVMADYEHTAYKTKPKDGWNRIDTVAVRNTPAKAKEGGFWVGEQIAGAVNLAREMSNTPGGDMTPTLLAEGARQAVKGTEATVTVLDRAQMEREGMGAVLGIAKGSAEEPKFIIVEYWGTDKKVKPVVLIGKGVTFDTGGLNIKGGDHMYEMHMDMSGGAAVIAATALAAKMKLKTNVIALVPAVENNPGTNAVRPGDILTGLSGKTIEVLNTDAEGRVILSDAITYAKRYKPAHVAEVSTLTGAALIAIGQQASLYMTDDEARIGEYQHLGEQSGDYMWPLPQWDEYEDMTRSTFADIPNLSTAGNSRYGGVIAGGMFLWAFAKELKCPWIHIDMAPRMTSVPGEFLAKGAAGAPVRFLYALIEKHAAAN